MLHALEFCCSFRLILKICKSSFPSLAVSAPHKGVIWKFFYMISEKVSALTFISCFRGVQKEFDIALIQPSTCDMAFKVGLF